MKKTYTGGRLPNQIVMDATEEIGAPSMVIADRPDWVTLPPELGGAKVSVTGRSPWADPCPVCRAEQCGELLTLDYRMGGRPVGVVCCVACEQFGWILLLNSTQGDTGDER